MILDSSEGSWVIGNTSQNSGVDEIKIWVESFLSALNEYNESDIRTNLEKLDIDEQKKFFDFCKQNYPLLARNTKDLEASVRKKKSFYVNYNFVTESGYLTELGDIFIKNVEKDYLGIKNASDKMNLSIYEVASGVGPIMTKSRKGNFYPMKIIVNKIIKDGQLNIANLNTSRYASDENEFIKILNLSEIELENFKVNEILKSDINYIPNRKSNTYSEFDEVLISFIKSWKVNGFVKSEINELKSKMKQSEKDKFLLLENFLKKKIEIKSYSAEQIFNFNRVYQLWSSKSYNQQYKIYASLSKFVEFDKNKIIKTKHLEIVNSFDINEDGLIVINLNNKIYDDQDEKYGLSEMMKISRENDILSDLMNNNVYGNPVYPKEIKEKLRYVLLEYFVAIELSKKMNVPFDEITNMDTYLNGFPKSHAAGKKPDIYIPKKKMIIEVTTSQGRTSEKMELEPVPRHVATIMNKMGRDDRKNIRTIFIADNPISNRLYMEFIKKSKDGYYATDTDFIEEMNIATLSINEFSEMLKSERDIEEIFDEIKRLDNLQIVLFGSEWIKDEYEREKWKILQNK